MSMGGNLGGNAPASLLAHGAGGGKSMQKDPRQIKDKQWQQKSIRTIISFLANYGYDRSDYSAAKLAQMSQKDFYQVFQFLYTQTDPNHQFQKKMEEEVLFLNRVMRYLFLTLDMSSIRRDSSAC